MPSKANLAIYQGDDYAAVVTVMSDSSSTPPDLTGYTANAHIRVGPADTYPQVVVEIATSIIANTINLSIPAAVTVGLSGHYVWDLQLTRPDGTITTILAGKVPVTAEVTREEE